MTQKLQQALEKAACLPDAEQMLIATSILDQVDCALRRRDQGQVQAAPEEAPLQPIDTDRGIPIFSVPDDAPVMTSEAISKALHDEL